MTGITDEEIRKMGEAMYPIINTTTKAFKQFVETVANFARLSRAKKEEIFAWKERMKVKEK